MAGIAPGGSLAEHSVPMEGRMGQTLKTHSAGCAPVQHSLGKLQVTCALQLKPASEAKQPCSFKGNLKALCLRTASEFWTYRGGQEHRKMRGAFIGRPVTFWVPAFC